MNTKYAVERAELARLSDVIQKSLSFSIESPLERETAIEAMIRYLEISEYNIQISPPVRTDKTDEEIWADLIKEGDPLKLIGHLRYNFIKLSSDIEPPIKEKINEMAEFLNLKKIKS